MLARHIIGEKHLPEIRLMKRITHLPKNEQNVIKADWEYCIRQLQWVLRMKKELITQGIVKKTRIIGRTQLYMINTNNEVVKKLIKMFNVLLENISKEHTTEEKLVI